MKRKGNLFAKLIDIDNLRLAHKNAKRGKAHYRDVKVVEQNPDLYLYRLQKSLIDKTFTTSRYTILDIEDGNKKRTIHKLPYYPDRIIHHALIQIIEPILLPSLIRDTYQSIKGRGVSDARKRITRLMKKYKPTHCLKIDIVKFYPSIDNEILKYKLRKKIKCPDTLWLINNIVDSTKGIPIGNYTSQIFGNFYLSDLDHYLKQTLGCKQYCRYCDDLVVMDYNKQNLHDVRRKINVCLKELNLSMKSNYQVFDIEKRGIDFVGYVFRNNKITLRKSIATSFKATTKRLSKRTNLSESEISSVMSYWGWIKPINAKNLWHKHMTENSK